MDILNYTNTSIRETGVESQILYFQIIGEQLRSSEECVEDMSTTNFTYDVIEYYKVNNNFS